MRKGAPGTIFLALLILLMTSWATASAQAPRRAAGSPPSRVTKSASKSVQPMKPARPIKIIVGKKSTRYYRASKDSAVQFPVQGPTSLRLFYRGLLPAEGSGPAEYRVRFEMDGQRAKIVKVNSRASKTAVLEGGAKVGTLRKLTLSIPMGRHRIRVLPEEGGIDLAVKGVRGLRPKKAAGWTPFAPEVYDSVLRLHEKDNEITVYRFTSAKAVEMTIHGPLRLRVMTRIDFGPANGTTQSYVVQSLLDGKPWKSFSQKSRASHTATYPEMTEVAPGMAREFTLLIPSGTHRVGLNLAGSTAAGATARLQIPSRPVRASRS